MKKIFLFLFLSPSFLHAQLTIDNSQVNANFEINCFGQSTDMYLYNGYAFIDAYCDGYQISSLNGKFLIDYGSDTSVIDAYGFPGGNIVRTAEHNYKLTFFNTPHKQYFYDDQNLGGFRANGIREAGILGTDILSQNVLTLDYKNKKVYLNNTNCSEAILLKLGFIPASTKGYFSNKKSNLILPLKNNNPTVPISIGDEQQSVQSQAQLDPGFDDVCYLEGSIKGSFTHIININQAYFDLLKMKNLVLLDRKSYFTLLNRTPTKDSLFKVNLLGNYTFHIIGKDGQVILSRDASDFSLFLKVSPAEAMSAGGISTFDFPAAQFGGTFLLECSKIIFDPFNSLIWFQPNSTTSKSYKETK